MKKLKRLNLIIGLTYCLFFCFACTEDSEGCLDAEATNFDVSADENCCCSYPRFFVQYRHSIDTLILGLGDPYNNDLNQTFSLNAVQFYLSEFELIKTNDEVVRIPETMSLKLIDESEEDVLNDFSIVRRNIVVDTIGSFLDFGDYKQLNFKLGLSDVARLADASDLSSHPLAIQSDSMWSLENGYIFNRLEFSRDTVTGTIPDTLFYDNSEDIIEIELPFAENRTFQPGYNTGIDVNVDYLLWFSGVDFETDTLAEIKDKIRTNIKFAFSLIE